MADTSDVSPADLAELERLRAEVAELRGRASAPPGRFWTAWRSALSALLIIVGCVSAPLSVVAAWSASQVSDTNRYVANVAPLIREPAIRSALTDKVTHDIDTALNLRSAVGNAAAALTARGMPRAGSLLGTFSGELASAVSGFIHGQVAKIVASPQVARLWTQLNRVAHAQVVKALSGQGGGAVNIRNGQVTLDLAPFIDVVKSDLSARGLTLVNKIPAIHPALTLFSARYLVRAQTAYRLLDTLRWLLPAVTLALLGLGIYVAPGHRRAFIGAGLGLAAAMLGLGAGLAVARGVYLNSVPAGVLTPDAAAAMFDTLVRFIKDSLRVFLVVGLLVAAGAFFTGPSVTAVHTRRAIASGLAWVRVSGENAGLRTGPAGSWTHTHRTGLRLSAVIAAAMTFVFWDQPSVEVAVVLAICLLVVLGLIELLGRPPAPQATGPASGG